MGKIVKIKGEFYILGILNNSLSYSAAAPCRKVYNVTPIKPPKNIPWFLQRALAAEDEFEELTETEKVLYGN